MSRGGFKITRVSDSAPQSPLEENKSNGDRVNWLDAFARQLEAVSNNPNTAVDAARTRNSQQSMLDQISSILNNKAHATVESKVQDYQDKTGLKEYLRRLSVVKDQNQKFASQLPSTFDTMSAQDKEDIVNFLRNKCETHHGNIQVPALVEEVSKTFRQRGLQPHHVNSNEFEKFVSDIIVECKKGNPSVQENNPNLGRGVGVDLQQSPETADVFQGMNPASK